MHEIESSRLVVGISPSQDHDAVLEYAAVVAERRRCGVHVVVVQHPVWSNTQDIVSTEVVGDQLRRVDSEVLLLAERRLRAWLPDDVPISTEITHGTVAQALCEIGRHSVGIALQHHRLGRMFHLPTLSVTNAVASRAPVSVVAVPDDWHEAEVAHDRVVAGIEHVEDCWTVAEAAFREAQLLGARLRLMHVWSWSEAQTVEDPGAAVTDRHERTALLRSRLLHHLEPLAASYPDVEWEAVASYGQAAYALIVQSEKARRLVLGRHAPTWRFSSHLGPVTRTVLTYAHCPVQVVDPRPVESADVDAADPAVTDTVGSV